MLPFMAQPQVQNPNGGCEHLSQPPVQNPNGSFQAP